LLQEVVVVEGYHDAEAVKRAVAAEVIVTSGYAISAQTFALIALAQARCGVVVLTDPDFAGEQIRRRISAAVPGCQHAFLSRDEATKNHDIGIEHAKPEVIREALEKARVHCADNVSAEFDGADMIAWGLVGVPTAAQRRQALGKALGIGNASAKAFRQRLNAFKVERSAFEAAMARILEDEA
jgi:ribonuclease M5